MKKININYSRQDVEELTQYVNKKYNKRKSPIRKMRKVKEDRQAYETPNKRNI